MNNLGFRVSGNRTVAVGNSKPDWTKQSQRYLDKDGNAKKPRKACVRNQVVIGRDGMSAEFECTIKQCVKVRIPTPNGGEKEVTEGKYNGKPVRRVGWVYGLVHNGKTPGRWFYV